MTEEYLDFSEALASGKTKRVVVRSRKHGFKLGEIRWYGAWRQYTFFPESDTVFNRSCMAEIEGFLEGLMVNWKAKQAEKRRT